MIWLLPGTWYKLFVSVEINASRKRTSVESVWEERVWLYMRKDSVHVDNFNADDTDLETLAINTS